MQILDVSDPLDAIATQLLRRMVCALVDHPAEVAIQAEGEADGAMLTIRANSLDVGKIIGNQGRTAKSLRTIMSGIGRKQGRRFTIVIDEGSGEREWARSTSHENISV